MKTTAGERNHSFRKTTIWIYCLSFNPDNTELISVTISFLGKSEMVRSHESTAIHPQPLLNVKNLIKFNTETSDEQRSYVSTQHKSLHTLPLIEQSSSICGPTGRPRMIKSGMHDEVTPVFYISRIEMS